VLFDHRPAHQIFVEPEGLNAAEVYPNGISTSLPYDVQRALVRSIKGFHNATITRPGYAIEYDYFDPRGLRRSLESRDLEGLYLAGQINGTTGYEEAAGQGLLAGVNAARSTQSREPWIPRRDQSYIGVMIDDLIVSGISEPYRMFTSRAEYRLQLREDNADLRLTAKGRELGLVDEHRWHHFSEKAEVMEREQKRLREVWARPGTPASEDLETLLGLSLRSETRLSDLLSRPEVII
jgi:tRNA uridine 5-carboxymethylaminomethyl modification enzyme